MIHLVTDSTAYLPQHLRDKYNAHVISLKICIEGRTCNEEGDITKQEFYRLLADVSTAPTTSQPAVGEFLTLYTPLVEDEDDEVISIHISEGISGTVPNAQMAAQQVAPGRIHVVDSRTSSGGLMILAIAAGEAIAAGKSVDQVLAMLDRMVEESCAYFMVEDLAYLHKGGRINTASRFLGTLLSIKPILYMHEGKIQALDKTRTTSRARSRVLDEVAEKLGRRPAYVIVAHIQAADAAEEMTQRARERLNCETVYTQEVGPVIGTHVGPGFLGVCACPVIENGGNG
jgi:DegV family protein with EDD domain